MKHYLTKTALFLITILPATGQQRISDSSGDIQIGNPGNSLRTQMVLPAFSFNEHPVNHNMHITSDGDYYYTINGGSSASGQINKFDLNGILLQTYPIPIDGRGLSYNSDDGYLYASCYIGDIVRINDLNTASFTIVHAGIMQNAQASFAISPDGSKFYNFSQGTLLIHDFLSGAVINTLTGLQFGAGNYGGEAAVAVDVSRIFTINASIKTVYIYDTTGTMIQTMPLDSGDNGQSLAIANGYLFFSKDGNYNMGTWYGYNIPNTTGLETISSGSPFGMLYPNPATNTIKIHGVMKSVEIFNLTGEKIISLGKTDSPELNTSTWPRGIYMVSMCDGNLYYKRRLVLE